MGDAPRSMAPNKIWAAPSDDTGTFGIWREYSAGDYSDGVGYVRADIVASLVEALDRLMGASEDDSEAIGQAYDAIIRAME